MNIDFNELFQAFKELDETEKKKAIIDFLKNDIVTLQELNHFIGNQTNNIDMNTIVKDNENAVDYLDIIYELIHLVTEQIEMFSEKTLENVDK